MSSFNELENHFTILIYVYGRFVSYLADINPLNVVVLHIYTMSPSQSFICYVCVLFCFTLIFDLRISPHTKVNAWYVWWILCLIFLVLPDTSYSTNYLTFLLKWKSTNLFQVMLFIDLGNIFFFIRAGMTWPRL